MKRIDRGVRESSESPPTPPSPPAYATGENNYRNSKGQEVVTASSFSPSSNHDKPRRKRRSGSRSSSTRSFHKRSRSRDRERERSTRKHSRRDRSRSRSRSRERRRSRSRNKSRDRQRHRRHHRQASWESDVAHEDINDTSNSGRNQQHQNFITAQQSNAFKNDGSFMEMFKKMQEQMPNVLAPTAATAAAASTSSLHSSTSISSSNILQEKSVAPPPLMVGKRRGGRILKTGMVAKPKSEPTADQPKDAWSLYMAEVKKYREVCCQEEDNTRPLVK